MPGFCKIFYDEGVARKKLRGGQILQLLMRRHLLITAYSGNIYENINFIEFLPSRKLADKLCKNFNAFFKNSN